LDGAACIHRGDYTYVFLNVYICAMFYKKKYTMK
jgi:hypothetical protein